jgi:FtsZ-binding cell division protein ZapB
MAMEHLMKLENKIDQIIQELKGLRQENAAIKEKERQDMEKISILEKEHKELTDRLSEISRSAEEDRKKIDQATEKVRDILGRLDHI